MTYEEMMTSDFFEVWFQKFLLPTLTTPSVIIMDNARFHRMGKLELLCEEFGHKLLPLPPYRLKNYLTDNPDAYLTEIASEFGCHPTTIHYALKAMGYTRKKEPHLL
ncbi:IS630-Spn1, transposase Orf2 [Streptococcus pneumoniae]|nr:IS630-Spn1, transposase Orf2 [Streptococcus pneumoniae]